MLFAAVSLALSIDMAQAPGTSVTVNYDINNGWSWQGAAWGETITMSQLVTTLVQPDPQPTQAIRPKKQERS
jgi:hypothetical protein